jgi:hypothetical protein
MIKVWVFKVWNLKVIFSVFHPHLHQGERRGKFYLTFIQTPNRSSSKSSLGYFKCLTLERGKPFSHYYESLFDIFVLFSFLKFGIFYQDPRYLKA